MHHHNLGWRYNLFEVNVPNLVDLLYDTATRAGNRISSFVTDPIETFKSTVNDLNTQAGQYNQALADSVREPLTGPKTMALAQQMAEGYSPGGIMIPAAKDVAFKAAMLEKKGLTPQQIHKELGVHRGAIDKQWRQELDDRSAFVKGTGTFENTVMNRMTALGKDKTAEPVTVGDVFHHSELYKHYPELKDIEVRFLPKDSKIDGRMATPEEGKGWLEMRGDLSSEQARDVMLHELQHPIQEAEGWAVGGSPSDFQNQDPAIKAKNALAWRKEVENTAERMGLNSSKNSDWYLNAQQKLIDEYYANKIGNWLPHEDIRSEASWPKYGKGTDSRTQAEQLVKLYGLDKKTTPYTPKQMYSRLGGEVEARQVQARKDLTPEQRLQYFPNEYTPQPQGYGIDTPISDLLYLNRQGYFNN